MKCIFRTIATIQPQTVQRYTDYWETIRPRTWHEKWKRWVFAFCSIRTGWKTNKQTYKLLVDNPWATREQLRDLLEKSKIGIYEKRTKGIWGFTEAILDNPDILNAQPNVEERDKLVKKFYGIGITKVAFSLEMCYPTECKVVCLDSHCCSMFGLDSNKISESQYKECERQWVKSCETMGYPSAIVRHILWDKIQKKRNTRYWSHVLEST